MKVLSTFIFFQAFLIGPNFALFCYTCLKSANDTCMLNKNPPESKLEICPEIPENEKSLGAGPLCYKLVKKADEKAVVNRGCMFAGGTISSDFFCANVTKYDNTTCHICKTDGCNKGNSLEATFMPFLLVTLLISLASVVWNSN